jgi:hypothetical protein
MAGDKTGDNGDWVFLNETKEYQLFCNDNALSFRYVRKDGRKSVETPFKNNRAYGELKNDFRMNPEDDEATKIERKSKLDVIASLVYNSLPDFTEEGVPDEAEVVG